MNPPELEKPRVTEILVRMDCNGCVQKIKKALHGINGIYDMYIDFSQQKLTIIGWADPEKIVKAIRKSRKTATICSHTEATNQQAQPTEAQPEGAQPHPESINPTPPGEAVQPAEPPKDPPPPENPPAEVVPPPPTNEAAPPPNQPGQPSGPKDVEEVHVIYHHHPEYGYRYSYGPSIQGYGGQGSSFTNATGVRMGNYPGSPGINQQTPPQVYVAHSYNTYKPSPYVTEYVSPTPQYSQPNRPELSQQHVHHSRQEPPQSTHVHYTRPEPPQHMSYSRSEPSQHMSYSRSEPPQHMSYSRSEPPQQVNNSRPEPAQQVNNSGLEPAQQVNYSSPERAQVNYSRMEPPKYIHYSRPEPPQYSYYSRPEYTYYSRSEHYNEDYHNGNSGNGNGNITSVFSDENPNACRIV